jgi:molybdopterin biosynthesis enzyme
MFKDKFIKIEKVSLLESLNRIIAQEIMSDRDEPPCNIAPIDGIALRYIDRENGLWNVGSVELGQNPISYLGKNECVNITKGSKVPQNSDVICTKDGTSIKDGQVLINSNKLTKILKVGYIHRQGKLLLSQGQVIDATCLTILAKNNFSEVNVFAKINVNLQIQTPYIDDQNFEIADFKIRDFVTPYIHARLPKSYRIVDDDKAEILINIVTSMQSKSAYLFQGQRFTVNALDTKILIECNCDLQSIQEIMDWLEGLCYI